MRPLDCATASVPSRQVLQVGVERERRLHARHSRRLRGRLHEPPRLPRELNYLQYELPESGQTALQVEELHHRPEHRVGAANQVHAEYRLNTTPRLPDPKGAAEIGEAALEHGSIPHYNSLMPEQRDRWRIHLAQRFGIPKSDIGLEDWERADSWKVPSLTWSLDAGFRPIEVGRAKTGWVVLDNGILRIPREDSSKNEATGRSVSAIGR